jgi:two-component system, OmpR family, sensor histidine kinase KdpD
VKAGDVMKPTEESNLLVCIGPSPSSEDVIRAGARMAAEQGVPWFAVTVEIDGFWTPEERDRISRHLSLAESLGAQVMCLEGRNVAEELVLFVNDRNPRRVVLGQTALGRGPLFRRKAIVTELMRRTTGVEIVLVPQPEASSGRVPGTQIGTTLSSGGGGKFLLAGAIMISAIGAALLIHSLALGESNTIMMLLLGVLLSSVFCGRLSGLAASVFAVLAFNFFFTEPRFTLVVDDSRYLVTFPIMLVVAFVTSELTTRLQRTAEIARERQERTERLYRNSNDLIVARSYQEICETSLESLERLLGAPVGAWLKGEFLGPKQIDENTFQIGDANFDDEVEREARDWAYRSVRPGGCGGLSHTESRGFYLPLQLGEMCFGVLGVWCGGTSLSTAKRVLLTAVSAQLALALDRERLSLAQEEARVAIERERVRANLLRSISHDFRTPLAAITGASSTLLADRKLVGEKKLLLQDVYSDALWLSELVENVLSLTRLHSGDFVLEGKEEVVEDLVITAINRAEKTRNGRRIDISLPEELLVARVDAGLFEQLILNLVNNALDFSEDATPVKVIVRTRGGQLELKVRDFGPGFSSDGLSKALDLFYTEKARNDSRRGLGLGLAISRTIVEAHGGRIQLENHPEGGAVATVTIPRAGPRDNGRIDG